MVAKWGMKAHDRWLLARHQLARRLVVRPVAELEPALADLVVARPILSAGLIARELKVTRRAAQDLAADHRPCLTRRLIEAKIDTDLRGDEASLSASKCIRQLVCYI